MFEFTSDALGALSFQDTLRLNSWLEDFMTLKIKNEVINSYKAWFVIMSVFLPLFKAKFSGRVFNRLTTERGKIEQFHL